MAGGHLTQLVAFRCNEPPKAAQPQYCPGQQKLSADSGGQSRPPRTEIVHCSLHPAVLSRELPTVLLHAAPCFKLPTLYRGSAAEGPGRLDMRITSEAPATQHIPALTHSHKGYQRLFLRPPSSKSMSSQQVAVHPSAIVAGTKKLSSPNSSSPKRVTRHVPCLLPFGKTYTPLLGSETSSVPLKRMALRPWARQSLKSSH